MRSHHRAHHGAADVRAHHGAADVRAAGTGVAGTGAAGTGASESGPPVPGSTVASEGLAGALSRLERALDEVGGRLDEGDGRYPGESDLLLRLVAAHRRVEALAASLGSAVEVGGDWAAAGFRSPRAWLVARANTGEAAAGRLFTRGRAEQTCPLLVASWRAGEVEWDHVRVVVDAHRRFPRVRSALQSAEPDIVSAARSVDPDTLSRELFGLLHTLDPEAVDEAQEQRRRGEVGLHISTVMDGFVRVDGLLPPEVGQCLQSVLAAAREAMRRDDPAEPDTSGVVDTLSQRNVGALQVVLGIAASVSGPEGLPSVHGSRPVLHVQVSTEALISGSAPGWIESVAGGRLVPITATSAQRLACDSVRRLIVVDESATVDAMSALSRVIPAILRRTVRLRDDGRCRFPGCRAVIHEVHHITHWAHGGPTTSGNLAGLCHHHHHLVHEGGWMIQGDANGEIAFRSPLGHRLRSSVPIRAPRLGQQRPSSSRPASSRPASASATRRC